MTLTFPSRGPLRVSAEALLLERMLKVLKREELRWITPLLFVPSRLGRVRGEMKSGVQAWVGGGGRLHRRLPRSHARSKIVCT